MAENYQVTSRDIGALVTFFGQVRSHYARLGTYTHDMCQLDRAKKELTLNGVDHNVVDAISRKTNGSFHITRIEV
jgi:molybdopterin synthase catalytic subunit